MESSSEEPIFEAYLGDLLNFMRYCKTWKSDTFSTTKNIVVSLAVGILLCSNIAIISATCVEMENAKQDLTSFASYVGPMCLQCIGLLKWTYSIWRLNDIAQLVGKMKKCHCISMKINNNDSGWMKYKREMEGTRLHYLRLLYGWLSLCMYGVLHWCANPIILEIKESGFTRETFVENGNSTIPRPRNFPYLGWRPWNVDDNSGYFGLFVIHLMGGISSTIGSVSYDVFYITALMFVCAHLRYLNDSLSDIVHDNVEPSAANANVDLEAKLKYCVNHHRDIITFLESLEIFASPIMFVQCLEDIMILCLVSLEASTVEIQGNLKTIMKLWSMLEYFLSVIIQLYFYCYYATEIRALGLQIADSAYLCSWERITNDNTKINDRQSTRRIKFFIQMIITRAQKAILLTGGPFYVLSLETFESIVAVAMSNSLILRQVVEERA